MDKWTKQFMSSGPSKAFLEVMELTQRPHSLEQWARKHTDGMFGAIFGLGQALEFLRFQPQLVQDLSASALEQYRRISAAAVLSQEVRIPPLFLLFRSWGLSHLREYLTWVISLSDKSHWNWMEAAWDSGINAVQAAEVMRWADLDEPTKLVIYRAAYDSGRLPTADIPPKYRKLPMFNQPALDDCVRYTLEDMKSTDIAELLKILGCKQSGTKSQRINRALDARPVPDLASMLNVTTKSYLHLGNDAAERATVSHATVFLMGVCSAVHRLDFQHTNNLHRIAQARQQKWGIRLSHHAKCPVHRKTVFTYRELDSIDPLAYPDCDASLDPNVLGL